MPRFTYTALDSRGQESTGLVEASSTNDAIGQLRQAGYFPTNVFEEGRGGVAEKKALRGAKTAVAASGATKSKKGIVIFAKKTVKAKMLMVFTRQLATLIDAGLPLLRGLNVLAKQERDVLLKDTINQLADSVQGGSTFSESLAQHPRIFNKLFVNMVKAGELGGVLEVVLARLAEFQEKAQKVKNKVKSAMIYPVIVLFLAMVIMTFLMVFIVPKFESIFHDMLGDKPLPAITQFVIGISGFMQNHWLLLIGGLVGLYLRLQGSRQNPGRPRRDRSARLARAALRRPDTEELDLAFRANVRHARHQRRPDFAGAATLPAKPPATPSSPTPFRRCTTRSRKANRSSSPWKRAGLFRRWSSA